MAREEQQYPKTDKQEGNLSGFHGSETAQDRENEGSQAFHPFTTNTAVKGVLEEMLADGLFDDPPFSQRPPPGQLSIQAEANQQYPQPLPNAESQNRGPSTPAATCEFFRRLRRGRPGSLDRVGWFQLWKHLGTYKAKIHDWQRHDVRLDAKAYNKISEWVDQFDRDCKNLAADYANCNFC